MLKIIILISFLGIFFYLNFISFQKKQFINDKLFKKKIKIVFLMHF